VFAGSLCLLALLISLAAAATPADAIVAKIGGHGYGITPINGAGEDELAARYEAEHAEGLQIGPLAHRYDVGPSGGTQLFNAEDGPVMHSATTHVIYWDPSKEFTTTTKGIVDGFFGNVAHDSGLPANVFAIAGQYTDSTGHAAYSSTSATPKTDTEKYPTGECTAPNGFFADPGPPYTECLLDEQLQAELSRFIAAEKLPVGPTQLYFLLLPHKVATCFEEEVEFEPGVFEQACSNNVFCAYHSYIEPGTANEIIYADIPFSLLDSGDAKGCQDDGHASSQQPNPDNAAGKNTETRFADVALKYISHEYIEAVTDPLVNEETAWVDAHGEEIGDKCNGVHGPSNGIGKDPNSFLPVLGGNAAEGTLFNQEVDTGHYYLQSEWDNAGEACLMKPLALTGIALGIGAATAGQPASFTSSAADPYGAYDPSWTFGDGGTATGPSPSHTYATAGEYTLTVTPKDALTGSTGSTIVTTVTVASPPPPAGPVVPPPPVTTTNAVTTTGSTVTSSSVATTQPVSPNSAFVAQAGGFNAGTGAITLKATFSDPGTLSWGATFANGKFGAFASSAKCKKGQLRLRGRCLPAKITFAKGSQVLDAAGSVAITLKPSASALKALKAALKQRKGVPVSIVLSFQSSRGGTPVSHAQTVTVKLKK
jgi:hypothetical protein